MQKFREFITGKSTAWITLLIGLGFVGLAFGPLASAGSDTTPGAGLPDDAESVLVSEYQKQLPSSDGTAVLILYRTADGSEFTESQLAWVQGEFDPQLMMPAGGANEKFLDYTSLELNGEPFVPLARIAEGGEAASITVPLEATDNFDVTDERINEMRFLASQNLPNGLEAYVTGPEAFVADLGNIFAGADFAILGASVLVVATILLITYRSPTLL